MVKRLASCAYFAFACVFAAACPNGPLAAPDHFETETWVKFSLSPSSSTLPPGSIASYKIHIDDKAILNAQVELDAFVAPPGFQLTINPTRLSETGRDADLTVSIPSASLPGTYTVTVRARLRANGQLAPDSNQQDIDIHVTGDSSFEMTCIPAELTLPPSGVVRLDCRIAAGAFQDPIDLSTAPHPDDVVVFPATVRISPGEGSGGFELLRGPSISAPGHVAPTEVTLVIIARSGSIERQIPVLIHLPPAVAAESGGGP
jgi:hypothetical protein